MTSMIRATFRTAEDAFSVIRELETTGISKDQVSVLMSDETRKNVFTIEAGNKTTEGATLGGALTGIAAAIIGGLAAAIPGVNIVASGALFTALAAGGAGTIAGGIVGALIGSGIPENEAKLYEEEIQEGAVLVAVEVYDAEQKKVVKRIFEHHQATRVAA